VSVVNLIVTSGLCFKKNISIRSGVLVYCCEDTEERSCYTREVIEYKVERTTYVYTVQCLKQAYSERGRGEVGTQHNWKYRIKTHNGG